MSLHLLYFNTSSCNSPIMCTVSSKFDFKITQIKIRTLYKLMHSFLYHVIIANSVVDCFTDLMKN